VSISSKAQDPGTSRRGGLFDSVKVLVATFLAIAHTRLELFSTEIEEQRVWLSSMLVWTLVALFCAGVGVVLATLFVVIALWDTHRLLALGIPAILFLVGAVLAWLIVLGKARARPALFAASLSELSKDHKELTSG
jgi:uncharacterized membrane protein YqjE